MRMDSVESKKRPASSAGTTPRKEKKLKGYSSVTKMKRKEADRSRGKTRVNIGPAAFEQWRMLKTTLGLKSDALVACLLLESYEKLKGAFSAEVSEPATSSPPSPPSPQDHDEKPQLVTPDMLFGPLLDKCPSCGFALFQRCLQNGHTRNGKHQPKSIEVTLGVELEDDPVSGAEQAEEESDISEEEEESEGSEVDQKNKRGEDSDEDWTPAQRCPQTLRKTRSTETAAAEEETGETGEMGEMGKTELKPGKRKLCPECGMFYQKKLHECEQKTKPFVCNTCGKRCTSESNLKIHNRIHSETYEHPCKFCNTNFKTRVDKLAHEIIHQEQKDLYKCPACAQAFTTFKERIEHMKTHGNQYKCTVCRIEFNSKTHFLRHVVVHTREKAFKCSICEHSFNQASHLKSHMRLHTGERPYSCKHCDNSFNHNVSLKSHMQRYHPKEQEDSAREMQETEMKEAEERNKAPSKRKRPPTGRPKGRPKRNTAVRRKYSKASEESDYEN